MVAQQAVSWLSSRTGKQGKAGKKQENERKTQRETLELALLILSSLRVFVTPSRVAAVPESKVVQVVVGEFVNLSS